MPLQDSDNLIVGRGDTPYKITYQDLKDNISGSGYWSRTGTNLSPLNAGDSVDIGSGKITLDATGGSITAANEIISGNEPYQGAGQGTKILNGDVVTARPNAIDNVFESYVIGNTNATIAFNAGGSADFSGTVKIEGSSNALFYRNYTGSSPANFAGLDVAHNGASKASIFADGSAELASNLVVANGYIRSSRFSVGGSPVYSAFNVSLDGTDRAFGVWQDQARPLATVNLDGSATFNGSLKAADYQLAHLDSLPA